MLHVTAALLDASTALVVPAVCITDELGVKEIFINGSAVLVSDKLVGYLDRDETMGYALGAGPVSGLLEVTTEDSAVLCVSESTASLKTSWTGDRVKADITVKAALSVARSPAKANRWTTCSTSWKGQRSIIWSRSSRKRSRSRSRSTPISSASAAP